MNKLCDIHGHDYRFMKAYGQTYMQCSREGCKDIRAITEKDLEKEIVTKPIREEEEEGKESPEWVKEIERLDNLTKLDKLLLASSSPIDSKPRPR